MNPEIEYDSLAGMHPRWLVKPLVWLANKMTGPIFIVQFIIFLFAWMAWNTIGPLYIQFDKAPFIGLNLFMSALAGVQASVIGVKQTIAEYNRDYQAKRHDAKYDAIIEHNEVMAERTIKLEELSLKRAKRDEEHLLRIEQKLDELAHPERKRVF